MMQTPQSIGLLFILCGCLILTPMLPRMGGAEESRSGEEEDAIVLTAEAIRAMNAHKMADVLNHVPGISAGDSSVGIHGSYKVKVFVDGRSINDPTSSHGAVNWELVKPDDVERIEILRGKGGLRYGQDASGGVILITTKRIRRLTGNVKAYGGNNDTGYGYASLQMTAGKWAVGVTGGAETTDGYTINNDKDRWQAGAKLAYTVDEKKSLSVSADYLKDERGLSGLPEYPTPFSRKSSQNTNLSVQARYNRLTAAAFFNDGRSRNTDAGKGIDQILRVAEWSEELASSADTGNWGELNFGGSYRMGIAEGSNFDDQKEETFSVFAAQSLKWADIPLILSLGIRANINTAFDDSISPEIKATFKTSLWRLTAAYSRTSNTPSFHQRYNRTSSTLPNPDLTVETSDNYSLAFCLDPHPDLSGSVSFFHNRLRDRITYVTGEDGVGQYQNFGQVTYTGGDLAAAWKVRKTFNVKAGYTYMEARDGETDLWLPSKARHNANLDLYWQPSRALSVVLSNKYVSKVFLNKNNTKTAPAYTLSDLRAEYAFRHFSVFAEIRNLFDQTYYYSDGLLAPPLTWIIGVNWRI